MQSRPFRGAGRDVIGGEREANPWKGWGWKMLMLIDICYCGTCYVCKMYDILWYTWHAVHAMCQCVSVCVCVCVYVPMLYSSVTQHKTPDQTWGAVSPSRISLKGEWRVIDFLSGPLIRDSAVKVDCVRVVFGRLQQFPIAFQHVRLCSKMIVRDMIEGLTVPYSIWRITVKDYCQIFRYR